MSNPSFCIFNLDSETYTSVSWAGMKERLNRINQAANQAEWCLKHKLALCLSRSQWYIGKVDYSAVKNDTLEKQKQTPAQLIG